MSAESWTSYNFAVVRVVPRVHLGTFVNVGVLVHARTAGFLGIRVLTDPADLAPVFPSTDTELLSRYLRSLRGICEGAPEYGPVALVPPSERFHWLTALRSDIIQSSPIHGGLCDDPERVLEELYAEFVERAPSPRPPPPPAGAQGG
jgi:hypothetical protein